MGSKVAVLILRIVEYGLTLSFPLLVLFIALTLYPLDYSEVSLFANENLQGPSYVSTLAVSTGYSGWQTGYGVVEDVEVKKNETVYILKVRVGETVVRVVVFSLNIGGDVKDFDLRNLKGLEVTFYGPQMNIRGERMVLARVLVTETPGMHGMHGMHSTMCMYKGSFYNKCADMMVEHMKMMRRYGPRG